MTVTITRRQVIVALVVILVGVAAAAGGIALSRNNTGVAGWKAAEVPGVLQCTGKVQKTPTSYVLACADGNAVLLKIRWTTWTPTAATGRATYSFNNCTPYCAVGKFVSFPAAVALSAPKHASLGLLFTRAVIVYKDATGKRTTETEQLPTAPLPVVKPASLPPSPVGSGYLATGTGYVLFIQWQMNGNSISGTAQDDYVSGNTPNEEVSSNTYSVSGELNGSQISISFNGGADTFGTFSANSFTLDFPQSDGSLVPAMFHSASAGQFNEALSTLQGAVNNDNALMQQADTISQGESTISKDIKTVDNDLSSLSQDTSGATASLGAFTHDLATEKADLATTGSAEQSVATEAAQQGAGNPQVCSDAATVASDADTVASDGNSVESALTTVRNDIGRLQSDFAQLQNDEAALPSYHPQAPSETTMASAVASGQETIAVTLNGANAAIDQANAYQTSAYQDAEGANNAGGCGSPPNAPPVVQHIS